MTIEPNCRGRARRQMSRPRDDRLTWSLSFFVVLAGLFVVALTIEPFLPQRHRGRGGWTVLGMVSVTAAIVFGAFAYDMVASD